MTADVIIVGAGAAGLMAARELRRAGKNVIILEASDRIGGRIMTLNDSSAGAPIDLGASFVHGEAAETTKLLDEARLAAVHVVGRHYRSEHGRFSDQGPAWKRMSQVFRRMDPDRREDRSFQDFLDEKPGGARLASERELARGFIQGFNGADTSLVSEKSLAEQGDPTEGASEARRIIKGYCAIIDLLKRDMMASIHLNHAVKKIVWGKSSVRVTDVYGTAYTASSCVVTVPLPILQDDTIVFEPEIPSVRSAARMLVMGHVAHVQIVARERFWEEKAENISFIHTPSRRFNAWWTQYPLQSRLFTAWSGGPPAYEMTRENKIDDVTVNEMAKVFGMRRSRVESLTESIHWYDWSSDPHYRGAYSYVGVGGSDAQSALARAIEGTLFIAGEATDAETGGTVEAALASGKRAANQILRKR